MKANKLFIFIIIFSCIAFIAGEYVGEQEVLQSENTCDIPKDYYEPSIKALEEELRISFLKHDKCISIIDKDKSDLVYELNFCSKNSAFLRKRANDLEKYLTECSDNLIKCGTQLDKEINYEQ